MRTRAGTAAYRLVVAAEVRAALRRAGINQTVLARHLGMSQPAVSRRLAGETTFTVDHLFRIAEILQVEVRDLVPGRLPEGAGENLVQRNCR